jgi:hypothetical protein
MIYFCDTLKYAKRLEETGLTRQQSEGIVIVTVEMFNDFISYLEKNKLRDEYLAKWPK